MGNSESSDSGGGNDSSSSCGGGISSAAIDRCVNTITFDNGGSYNCRTGESSSYSLNDAIGYNSSNSGVEKSDEDRPTYSSGSSYDRKFVKDCYRSEREAYDKLLHTIDLGNGNSYNNRTGEYSYNSLSGVIGKNAVVVGSVSVEQQKTQLLRTIKEHRADPMIKAMVTFNLNRRIDIKPDTDTKRYVDNIDKYREFVVIYNGANKDYKDGKITWGECIQIKYEAKMEYDNDYWSALDNITRYQFELWDAYDKGFININKYNEFSNIINEKCAYILTTNNVTVHQKPPAPAPVTITPTSPQPCVENGHVMSAQARVNAVNQVASVVSSGTSAIGNAYIQGANNTGNYNRMEAQATQHLVSNVASVVGNGATAVGNGFVNPSANSEQTNQVLNMVSNAPSAVDLCLSNPRGIGINIATGMLAEVNNSYNERSTMRNMVNGTIGAVGLVAGVVGAPVTATTIAVGMLGAETLELANNLENNYTRQITQTATNENQRNLILQHHERGRLGCM